MAADEASRLIISEIFGPTVQGEGPSAGMPAMFVRLGECNLTCQWCDTPYTWDWSRYDRQRELVRMEISELADWILRSSAPLVVITGGEPLLQQSGIVTLLRAIDHEPRRIEIETNGTIAPSSELVALVDQFNVSPKLSNSAVRSGKRIKPRNLALLESSGKAVFKFVVEKPDELLEIRELVRTIGLSRVYVMPQGRSPDEVICGMQNLVESVVECGWTMSVRLHILIWGDKRGV